MPSAIDELIKRRVIQQWISGWPRDKIAAENNIGAGTVSSIVSNYRTGFDNSDFESVRGLSIELRKQGLNFADLSSHLRLYNFFRESEVPEEDIESFVAKVHSSGIPQEKVVEYVNELYDVSKEDSIPIQEVPTYIKQKLEEKQKIEQEIKDVNDILQNTKVTIEAINEHLRLREELDKHDISTQDIDKLLILLSNAKENGFDSKKMVTELRSIERLEKRKNRMKKNYEIYSKQLQKYKDVLPLAEEIVALQIGIHELIALKAAINQAVKLYNLPPLAATLKITEDIKKV